MRGRVAVAFTLILALGAVLPVGAAIPAGDEPTRSASLAGHAPRLQDGQNFDRTEFRIIVYENGSARWIFAYKESLTNESQRQQFEEFAERFNTRETELFRDFVRRARALTRKGTNVTGRPMNATAFTKEARITGLGPQGNQGVVRMSFLWTNFAATSGDQVRVGDVFQGGLYIGPNQKLVVVHGPELEFERVDPSPDSKTGESIQTSRSVTWVGPTTFSDQHPQVVLGPPGTATRTTTDGNGGTDSTDSTPTTSPSEVTTTNDAVGPGGSDLGLLPWLGLMAVVLLGAGAAIAYRTGAFDSDDDGGAVAADGVAVGPRDDGDGGAAAEGLVGPAVPDEEFMSDEDRVLSLLDGQGGRMKQVNIVDETGWSKSKVSMLLSDMEEADQISKLRVGRENIISLRGEEPDAAGSPFEED